MSGLEEIVEHLRAIRMEVRAVALIGQGREGRIEGPPAEPASGDPLETRPQDNMEKAA